MQAEFIRDGAGPATNTAAAQISADAQESDRDKSTVSGDGSLTIIVARRSERCSRCTVYIFTTKRSYAEDSVSPTTRRHSGSRREPILIGRCSAQEGISRSVRHDFADGFELP
jgi:hypothetical protein